MSKRAETVTLFGAVALLRILRSRYPELLMSGSGAVFKLQHTFTLGGATVTHLRSAWRGAAEARILTAPWVTAVVQSGGATFVTR